MALTSFAAASQISWALAGSSANFAAPTQSDKLQFNLSGLSLSTWDQLYASELTIAASGSSTIDLTSFTNLVSQSVTFAHVFAIAVSPSGANVSLAPGATNGLVWFFGSATDVTTVKDGGYFFFSEGASSTGTVVDATHKNLTITNLSGSVSVTVSVVILGSTS